MCTQIKEKEKRVQLWKPLLLTLCFGGMAVLQILKNEFECGSALYWFFALAVIPWVLPFFVIGRRYVLKDTERKMFYGYVVPKGDVKWDGHNSVKWPLVCAFAGVSSALFGIGGGM